MHAITVPHTIRVGGSWALTAGIYTQYTTTHASFLRRAETGSKSAAWNEAEVLTLEWHSSMTL